MKHRSEPESSTEANQTEQRNKSEIILRLSFPARAPWTTINVANPTAFRRRHSEALEGRQVVDRLVIITAVVEREEGRVREAVVVVALDTFGQKVRLSDHPSIIRRDTPLTVPARPRNR